MEKWETINSEILFEDKWIKIRQEKCRTSDGIIITPYYILDYPDWVNLVCFNSDNHILINRQYRHGINSFNYELPGGVMDKEDSSPLAAAKRELKEETGYISDNFEKLISYSPNPANHSNSVHCFVARDLIQTNERSLDESEEIEYEFMPFKRVLRLIKSDKFRNSKHIASVFMALEYLDLIDIRI